jgi:hypothetical protein
VSSPKFVGASCSPGNKRCGVVVERQREREFRSLPPHPFPSIFRCFTAAEPRLLALQVRQVLCDWAVRWLSTGRPNRGSDTTQTQSEPRTDGSAKTQALGRCGTLWLVLAGVTNKVVRHCGQVFWYLAAGLDSIATPPPSSGPHEARKHGAHFHSSFNPASVVQGPAGYIPAQPPNPLTCFLLAPPRLGSWLN